MMETLDARKKQPPLTWEDEHRWTTSKLADQLKQEYWNNLNIPGSSEDVNQTLERAMRLMDCHVSGWTGPSAVAAGVNVIFWTAATP